jgi:hypothetical protein
LEKARDLHCNGEVMPENKKENREMRTKLGYKSTGWLK